MFKIEMKMFFVSLLLLSALMACQSTPNIKQVNKKPFDLDTLYSSRSIIGTTPKSPVWSSNSQKVIFLWNDKGYAFRDVWSYSLDTKQKTRLTKYADTSKNSSDIKHKHTGISHAIWLNDAGERFAYVLNDKLFVQNGGSEPKQLETNKTNIKNLTLSPNGLYLAFVSDGSLWVRSTQLSNINSDTKLVNKSHSKAFVESYEWSNDSRQIVFQLTDTSFLPERDIYYYADSDIQKNHVQRAFPGDETSHFNVGIVHLDSKVIQLFNRPDDKHYVWNYGLSNDGKSVFINSSDLLVKQHSVYTYSVDNGQRTVFYQEYDAKHLRPDWQVQWAPNDDGLIILTDRDGFLHLYHQKFPGENPKALTSGQWEIASFKVDNINNEIYFTANKSYLSERQIYRISLTGGDIERVSPPIPGSHQMTLSPDKNRAATLFSNDSTPLELSLIDLNNKNTAAITHSPLPQFYQHDWADISYIEFNSHLDGTKLVGRLSLPSDYSPAQRYPLIVGSVYSDSVQNQYGGRTSHPTWGLDQVFGTQGYIVLNVNVRGSWGQGRIHNQGLRYGYGVIDIEDLHSGVKHLIKEGYVDPERVGIWGSSYGGLMTMMSLFKKPGVYAAGIAGAPATNVAHAYPGQMWVMGEPTGADQPGRYQQQSALYHTNGLEDPLMIIHGSKDSVVLYSDTIAVVEKLIAQQKMFELVTMPGSGHGWDNEGNTERLFSFKKMLEFFNNHLKPIQQVKQ